MFVDEREIKGSEDKTMEGVMIEEGTSSEARKNLNGGMVTNWRNLFSTTVDQVLNFYSPQKSNGKLVVP